MNNIILGDIPACGEAVVLPLVATATGTWAFMTTFNGAYQYVQFQAVSGQHLVVPAKLNEDYTYNFKLYQPDNTIFNNTTYHAKTIPLLPYVDYECPSVGDAHSFSMGKLQLVATDGQTEVSFLELNSAKQVTVFVEGAMRQEGADADEYVFDKFGSRVVFNTGLLSGQKITILYFK